MKSRPRRALSLPEQIADHIGHLILAGRYRPGAHLTEQEIAAAFAVSRGPVRDAFRMLETRGLIEIRPRRGAHVIDLKQNEIVDIFNIRAALLGLAAGLAAAAAPERLEPVGQRIRALKSLAGDAACDPLAYGAASRAAQGEIAIASGNRRLAFLLEELGNRAIWRMIWGREPLDHETPARRRRSAAHWRGIWQALSARDAEAAERRARDLIDASRDHTLERIALLSQPAMVRPPETLSTWPVTKPASSPAKKRMAPGRSSG